MTTGERAQAAGPCLTCVAVSLLLVPGAGHSSIAVIAWDRYRAAVQGFAAEAGCRP